MGKGAEAQRRAHRWSSSTLLAVEVCGVLIEKFQCLLGIGVIGAFLPEVW